MLVRLYVYMYNYNFDYFCFRVFFLEGVTHFYNEFMNSTQQALKHKSFVGIFNFVAIYHILSNMTKPFDQKQHDPKHIKWQIHRNRKIKPVLLKFPSKQVAVN